LNILTTEIVPFAVAIPHQRPAYLVTEFSPIVEDGDDLFAGDHDLHGFDHVETIDDAVRIIEHRDADLHQLTRRSVLVVEELIAQGVLAEVELDDSAK
jgi:hypothetical protein